MSHFVVMVIGEDFEKQLAPYHEFECTGQDDEYVQEVDKTEEARQEYEKSTSTAIQLASGKRVSLFTQRGAYRRQFLRDPSPEEEPHVGMGSGSATLPDGRRVQFTSRDWNDGLGYRAKVVAYPDGATEVEVPAREVESFAEWAADYYGTKIVRPGRKPNLKKTHKYGYILVDAQGDVVKVVDRTNPNRKWDWYSVGGRWTGYFKMKPGARGQTGRPGLLTPPALNGHADQARKGDIDWEGMAAKAAREAGELWDRAHAILDQQPPVTPWEAVRKKHCPGDDLTHIEAARTEYHTQPGIQALRKDHDLMWEPDQFLVSRGEYVRRSVLRHITPFAVVYNGQWYEKGKMGWWGMVANEEDQDTWADKVAELLTYVSDDTMLTIVDCHI